MGYGVTKEGKYKIISLHCGVVCNGGEEKGGQKGGGSKGIEKIKAITIITNTLCLCARRIRSVTFNILLQNFGYC